MIPAHSRAQAAEEILKADERKRPEPWALLELCDNLVASQARLEKAFAESTRRVIIVLTGLISSTLW